MRASAKQIAGALLEEAVMVLLRHAGYRPLDSLHGDPSILPTPPRFTIRGRGSNHQIDAVADPVFLYPFTNPARLLIEGKAYANRRVGLGIVRNAVGTCKDLSEFWRPASRGKRPITRYHYRYAIFATTDFTKPAQAYAYAQDVYLLPLRQSTFFGPVVTAIDDARTLFQQNPERREPYESLSEYRDTVRTVLRGRAGILPVFATRAGQDALDPPHGSELLGLQAAVREVGLGLVAMAGREFPLFLVPRSTALLDGLQPVETVRIFRRDSGWYLVRARTGEELFSFDLPRELAARYAVGGGELERRQAVRLKSEEMRTLQALWVREDVVQVFQFRLDQDWIEALLQPQE